MSCLGYLSFKKGSSFRHTHEFVLHLWSSLVLTSAPGFLWPAVMIPTLCSGHFRPSEIHDCFDRLNDVFQTIWKTLRHPKAFTSGVGSCFRVHWKRLVCFPERRTFTALSVHMGEGLTLQLWVCCENLYGLPASSAILVVYKRDKYTITRGTLSKDGSWKSSTLLSEKCQKSYK